LSELRRQRARVKAFLISGAGNDIIGEDPVTREPMMIGLLRDFNGDTSDVTGHVDSAAVNARLSELSLGYNRMVGIVRAEPGLENLPIVVHGYDYAIPYPAGAGDRRNPRYAAKDQWLGRAFAARGIMDPDLRRRIVAVLIDRLYDMLFALRDAPGQRGVHVVDCRGALPDVSHWADEIHGTSAGFAEVGRRFRRVIDDALATGRT
ncbi:MAG: hypothetical protein WBA25_06145, partial [Jannaschia sp.]